MDQTEDEREDGEIVDDEFDEISDYSMPSDGKSDYSQDLLRPISLSSISDSDGEREYLRKYYLPARKRNHKCDRNHRKKRRKSTVHRRSRPSSFSSSDNDGKLDSRTLRQLKEAVRINSSHELHHNSLRTRLKGMIEPDSQDEEIEALRNLALITSKNKEEESKEDKEDDSINDKELIQLRQEALKSAILKKHMERKRRKEMMTNPEPNKENTENNNIQKVEPEKLDNVSIEEDVDVMRAMLLASMSKKMTSVTITTSTPLQKPIDSYNKPTTIKPIIINLNSDSDSESDAKPSMTPIDQSVTAFLKKQREQFEAKCGEREQSFNKTLLDKSVVKLLSKPQQKEYRLLKQKLWLARRKKIRRLLINGEKGSDEKNKPDGLKKTLLELQFQKDGRLQTRGKYKELAPLIEKVNQASSTRKIYEERIKKLLKDLDVARSQLAEKHENYTSLVQQLIKEKKNIDLRLSKFALTNPSTKPSPPKPTPINLIKPEAVKPLPEEVQPSETEKDLKDTPNHSKYVSPLDHRESQSSNPLQMLCPYELFGVCKDPECNFNHCP